MKIKPYSIHLGIIAVGILFSLYLQGQLLDDVYFSGDAGLKALLAQQLSTGELRFDLAPPSETWVQQLWNNGLYPYQPPFVYKVTDQYYITFPFTFPLITAPFHALFGYRGLYLIPLVSTWAIWLTLYGACQRLKLSHFSTSLALISLIFASHLTLYSAMYWEHTLAVAFCFAGVAMLLIPGESGGLSKRNAVISGSLIGLAAWFRPEFLSMVATLSAIVCFAALTQSLDIFKRLDLKSIGFLSKNIGLFIGSMFLTVALFFISNKLVYGRFLGMHSVEVVEGFSLSRRLAEAWESFQELSVVGFEYFPVAFFALLYLLLYLFRKLEAKLNLKIVTIGLIVVLMAGGGYLFATAGAVGLKAAIKQWGLLGFLGIAWIYLLRKVEIKLKARMALVYLICLFFTAGACLLLDSGADEVAVGGKQWGPRYLLSLIPLVSLIVVEELNVIKEASRPILRYASISLVSVLLVIGIYKNVYSGVRYLQQNHQGISPAIQALRDNPTQVIVVSHQYAAQVLEPPFQGERFFFRAETSKDVVQLSKALVEQNQDKFIYVCYPFRECSPPEDAPENLTFRKDNSRFQVQLSNLGKFGKYPIYEGSINRQV